DPTLNSEKGWQIDASYQYEKGDLLVSFSPFASWFSNYIYLKPTGEWSILPHAGQIYRYTGNEALFAGAETELALRLVARMHYRFSGEYVYTYNIDEHTALSFSPPASMRNTLTWKENRWQLYAELHSIADQNRIARNEDPTPGANLVNLGGNIVFTSGKTTIDVGLSVRNLLNTKYYNHLSFYRKVEIPEPGRNLQLVIKIYFNNKLQ
ncbi:MAG: TonB-dependent receptor domain-containing protein, partial [Bacteroidales bacterium]